MKDLLKDYKLHISVLIISILSIFIGTKTLKVGDVAIVFSPLIWSMLIMFAFYMSPAKVVTEKSYDNANYMLGIAMTLLIVKLGVSSGSRLQEIKEAGLALILQNFGNLGTILISLPVALLLGLERESIGMCHALSREANVGLIQERYTAHSAEFRGVMAVYIIGTILGPIVMSIISSIAISTGLIGPLGASMGVGAGSASMMTAGLSALIETYPQLEAQMSAFAGLSNLISSVIALPLGIFLGLPITEFLYGKLHRKKKNKDSKKKEGK